MIVGQAFQPDATLPYTESRLESPTYSKLSAVPLSDKPKMPPLF